MKKIKGLLVLPIIIVIVVTFFGGIAFATRDTKVIKEKGNVFVDCDVVSELIMRTEKCFFLTSGDQLIDSIVQEISTPESVVEKNGILLISKRKKRKSTEQIYRESSRRQKIIQEDYIRRMQEQERIEYEEEQKRIKEQEKKEEQERKEEQEKIKKEDPFR